MACSLGRHSLALAALSVMAGCRADAPRAAIVPTPVDAAPAAGDSQTEVLAEGQRVFRFETFGDEAWWTDKARLHEIAARVLSPETALKLGLKVDAEAIPSDVANAIKAGKVDLGSPATTLTLLKLNAVVGLVGDVRTIDGKDQLVRLGITCALCHSTVDDSFAPGIGRRLDGWPNRYLDVGAIIALSAELTPEQKAVYSSWGPGYYDPRYNLDGKSDPLVLPPVYGLAQVKNETCTADGAMSYWNAYVAVTQMHGLGSFSEPRLGIEVTHTPDLVAPKLAALRAYQNSLQTPAPPAGSFDAAAAERGMAVFKASCVGCHAGTNNTDNNDGTLHDPSETGMSVAYAARTVNKAYRTTPLRALWQHPPYFHDGSSAKLEDVVDRYDRVRKLALADGQKADLVQFLKSL